MTEVQRIAEVLGGEKILGQPVHTLAELNRLVMRGLPKSSLRFAAERVARTGAEARDLVYRVVPESTYKRRKRLSPAESERSERLARTIALAEFTWGENAAAHTWLNDANPHLDGSTPLEAAETELGARQVEAILMRAVYGIPV